MKFIKEYVAGLIGAIFIIIGIYFCVNYKEKIGNFLTPNKEIKLIQNTLINETEVQIFLIDGQTYIVTNKNIVKWTK